MITHPAPRATAPPRARRRLQRGVAAVELALGLPIIVFVLAAGIHFGDSMYVRQRLGVAASRAVRICAPRGEDGILNCIDQQARASLGTMLLGESARCDPLQTNGTQIVVVDQLKMITARLTCRYTGGFSRIVRRFAQDANVMLLRSQASMPITEH